MIDEVLHNVASQRNSTSLSCITSPQSNHASGQLDGNSCVSELELSALRKSVQELTTTVDKLSNQLKFVLSYLDISNVTEICPVNSSHLPPVAVVAAEDTSTTAAAGGTTAATVVRSGVAAAVPITHRARPRPTSLKEAVVTAVHIDQRDRERRARTVIVSGLMQQNTATDADCFRQFVMHEFDVDPVVKFTKRLGTAADGRMQRLLVGLQSADQATDLINQAKQLRRSTDEYVRTSVYINRNLTIVEAKLAYEERCRRRSQMSQQHRTGRRPNSDDRRVLSSSSQVAVASQIGVDPSLSSSSSTTVDSYRRCDLQQQNTGGSGVSDMSLVTCSHSVADNQHEGVQQPINDVRLVSDCTPQLVQQLSGATSVSATFSGATDDGRHR